MIAFYELLADEQIEAVFPLMRQLRPHLSAATFLSAVRAQQAEGYRLFGGEVDSSLVVLAGVRETRTLLRGLHLFVDDLVTLQSSRGLGHGKAMLQFLAAHAQSRGLERIYLDSRDTALGFYEKLGFQAQAPVTCWIEVATGFRLSPPEH